MSDLAYITRDTGSLNDALDLARLAVEKFYTQGNSSSGISSIQTSQKESLVLRSAENASLDLSGKTVPELIELLSHRDVNLKARVAQVLKLKAVESKEAADVRVRDQVKEHLVVAPVIQTLFACATIEENRQLQSDILVIVQGILTDPIKERIRQVGCIPALASLWKKGTEESFLTQILTLTRDLTTVEMNCVACKTTKRVPELCNLLKPEGNLSVANRALLVAVLLNLSKSERNRDQIAKTGVASTMIELVNQLWKTPLAKKAVVSGKDAMLTQQLLNTLANLALGSVLKTSVTPTEFQLLVSLVDAKKTLKKDWMYSPQPDQEFFIMTMMQCQILQLLAHLATNDANRRTLGQLNAVQLLLMYCLPGDACIPADGMHYWVDCMDHLIQNAENRALFLKYHGLNIGLQLITSPKTVEYQKHRKLNHRAIDLIVTCISHGPQDDSTLNTALQTLILYSTQNTDDENLQMIVTKAMRHISDTEAHLPVLGLIPGVIDFAIKSVLETSLLPTIEDSVAFLINAATVANVKTRLNGQAAKLVPGLIAYLGNDQPTLQILITKALAQIFATTPTGANSIVDFSGILVMLTLLGPTPPELQEQALAVLENLVLSYPDADKLRHSYLASSVLPAMVDLLSSDNEHVQLRAFSLLSRLIDHRACKIALDTMDMATKLKDLRKHPNVVKDKSTIPNLIDTILPHFAGVMVDLKNTIAMTEDNPEAATDKLLSQLTKWQLMQFVKYALNTPIRDELMPLIDDTIQANIANPPKKKNKAVPASSESGVDSTSITAGTGLNPILMVPVEQGRGGGPAPPPPPPAGGPGAPPPPAGAAKRRANTGSVLEQLTALSKRSGVPLKKIDASTKEKEKQLESIRSNTSMASVFQGIKDSTSSNPEGTRLLEQGTTDGRQFWVKDPSKFIEEIQKSFSLDYNFMKILLHLVSSTVATVSFDSLVAMSAKKDKPIEGKALAEQLRNLGFTVKHSIVLLPNSETPVTQYTSVIIPGELPIQQVCRTIVWTVAKANATFANSLPTDVRDALSGKAPAAASSSATFQCRLCQKDFPSNEAVDVQGRSFCQGCSAVVAEALAKRAAQ